MTEKYSVAQISKLSVESLRLGLLAVVVAFACLPSTAQAQQFDEQEFDRINTELSEAMSELGSDLGSSKRKALLEKLKRGVERIRQLKQRAGDEEGINICRNTKTRSSGHLHNMMRGGRKTRLDRSRKSRFTYP